MSTLDCATPVGQRWIAAQRVIVHRCAHAWGLEAIQTPPDHESPVDVFFVRDGMLAYVAEVKARNMTLAQLQEFGSYLVTKAKIQRGRDIALDLCVPYRLIVGLHDAICWWMVVDGAGSWRVRARTAHTATQATCNGGSVMREHAYLSLRGMNVIPIEPPSVQGMPDVTEIRW